MVYLHCSRKSNTGKKRTERLWAKHNRTSDLIWWDTEIIVFAGVNWTSPCLTDRWQQGWETCPILKLELQWFFFFGEMKVDKIVNIAEISCVHFSFLLQSCLTPPCFLSTRELSRVYTAVETSSNKTKQASETEQEGKNLSVNILAPFQI